MIREVKIDSFDDICSSFSIWIIKDCSQNYTFPLYMVWYSDPNVEGRHAFMLDKSGCIFAVTDLVKIKEILLRNVDKLQQPNNLMNWLACFGDLLPEYAESYNVGQIENNIRGNDFYDESITQLIGFVNLFGDFVYQSNDNLLYERELNNKYISMVCKYYDQYIQSSNYKIKEQYNQKDKPRLEINHLELLHAFIKIRYVIEENISIIYLQNMTQSL